MAVHHGGKVGKSGKTLTSKSSTKKQNLRLAAHYQSIKLLSINF